MPRIDSSGFDVDHPHLGSPEHVGERQLEPHQRLLRIRPLGRVRDEHDPELVGSALLSVPAAADIAGLAAGTTYHFRAVAVNGIGTTAGPDQTFTTLPPEETQEEEKPKPARRASCASTASA